MRAGSIFIYVSIFWLYISLNCEKFNIFLCIYLIVFCVLGKTWIKMRVMSRNAKLNLNRHYIMFFSDSYDIKTLNHEFDYYFFYYLGWCTWIGRDLSHLHCCEGLIADLHFLVRGLLFLDFISREIYRVWRALFIIYLFF